MATEMIKHTARMRGEWKCSCGRWLSDNHLYHDHVVFDTAYSLKDLLVRDPEPIYSRHVKTPANPSRLVPYDAPEVVHAPIPKMQEIV